MATYPVSFRLKKPIATTHCPKQISKDKLFENIMRMVIDADRQNKNLLIISDAIVKSSFINTLSSPPIVSKLEEELREAFNEIISNLRQYFIDVDDKLKRIGQVIDEQLNRPVQKQNVKSATFCEGHTEKIVNLEASVKQMQENQKTFIQIINNLISKPELDKSVTENKSIINHPLLRVGTSQINSVQLMQKKTSHQPQAQFFSNSLQASIVDRNPFEPRKRFKLYSRQQQRMNNSIRINSFHKANAEKLDQKISTNYDTLQPLLQDNNSFCLQTSQVKTSLKRQKTINIIDPQGLNRGHRLLFMMNMLKS